MFSVRLDLAGIVFDISSKYAGLHILQGAYFKPFLSRALPDFKVFLHIDDTWMERESSFAPRVVTREDGTVSFQSQSLTPTWILPAPGRRFQATTTWACTMF